MSLLSVVKDVCAVVGVTVPQAVLTSITANRTMQEMLSLANEMAQRIAYDTRDWTRLRLVATIAGDGVATAFDLPVDFKRMLLTTNVYNSASASTSMMFIPDTDEWLVRRARIWTSGFGYNPYGEWTLLGGQIHFFPAIAAGQTAFFAYLNRNCIALASGGVGDSFMADGDGFLLDERLLKLGMIWQWKANKGSPYAEDVATYSDALAMAMGHDSPAPIIISPGRRQYAHVVW